MTDLPPTDGTYCYAIGAERYGALSPLSPFVEAISDRLAWYRESIARMEQCPEAAADSTAGERFSLGLGLATYRAAADYLEEHAHELLSEVLLSEGVEAAD